MIAEAEKHRFEELVSSFLLDRVHTENGIGTYKEKSLHFLLKTYFEPDTSFHEISYKGYVADIKNECGITEIQTANVRSMKKKLEAFLTEDRVRVIIPLDARRHLVWIDAETGEANRNGRASAGQNKYKLAAELLCIRELLENENLTLTVVTLETDDYRVLNGYGVSRKSRAEKLDRIPSAILDLEDLSFPRDYCRFIPEKLPSVFTREEYARLTHLRGRALWGAMKLLSESGIIRRIDSESRAYKYEIIKK